MIRTTTITFMSIGLVGALVTGCGGGGSGGGGGASTAAPATTGAGQLDVQLTDAPLQDLTHVRLAQVTVERVEVHVAPVGSGSSAGVGSASGSAVHSNNGNGGVAAVGSQNAHGMNPNAKGGNPNAGGANAQGNGASTAAVGSAGASSGGGRGGPGGPTNGTWLTIFDAAQAGAPQTFNLLDLRGGVTAALANAALPAGSYTHLRLVISGAELIVDTTSYSTANGLLTIPSGSVQIAFSGNNAIVVTPGQTTQVLLDFDVARSFNSNGPPSAPTSFTLMPTIRGANLAVTGSLAGVVRSDNLTPADATDDAPLAAVTVEATQQGQTITTYTDAQGAFVLAGLDVGAWDVTFKEPAHTDRTISVTIARGQQTTQDALLAKK
jgi:hypothetical protein